MSEIARAGIGLEKEKKRILVVDDDKASLQSLKQILQLVGYSVDTAKTGREAIEKSETGYYNLALLDITLPDMKGTELVTKMQTGTPWMTTIMITGYPTLETAIEALNLGADAYILKPYDPKKLLETIEEKIVDDETRFLPSSLTAKCQKPGWP